MDIAFSYYIIPAACWFCLYVSKEWDRLARKQIEKNIATRPMGDYYWSLLWACLGGYKKLIRCILSHPDFVFPSETYSDNKELRKIEELNEKLFLMGRDYLVSVSRYGCLWIFDEYWLGRKKRVTYCRERDWRGYKKFFKEAFWKCAERYEELCREWDKKRNPALGAANLVRCMLEASN